MFVCWSVNLYGFLIHVLNSDKVYLFVLNMFLVLNFNSLELNAQLIKVRSNSIQFLGNFLSEVTQTRCHIFSSQSFKENFQSLFVNHSTGKEISSSYTFTCFYRRKIAANALVFSNGMYRMSIINFYFHYTCTQVFPKLC